MIILALKSVLTIIFSYQNALHKQTFGIPQGPRIFPPCGQYIHERIESRTLSTFHITLKLWFRFVDDTFCLLKSYLIAQFHEHKCEPQPHTVHNGRETELLFSFLGRVRRPTQPQATCTGYEKPTLTSRYLHYNSHHAIHQKLTSAETLPERAKYTT